MRRFSMLMAAAAVLSAVGFVGDASAQPVAQTDRLITVNGSASRSVSATASDADQLAAYRAALSDALSAAKHKAGFVASTEGVTLGQLQTVTEQTDAYPGYCGYSVSASSSKPGAGGTASPGAYPRPHAPAKHKRRLTSKHRAHRASATPASCAIGASVTVTYLVS